MRINTVGTIYHGSLGSIGATALQLTATSRRLLRGVRVKASVENAATHVYVGLVGVTAGISAAATDGFQLGKNEEILIEIDDPSKLYVISDSTGQAVTWLGC